MNIKTTLKSSVAAAALFAVAAPVSTTAMAADDTLKSGQKTNLTMSGFITRAIFHADNGNDEKLFYTGGGGGQTRIRWVASGTLNDNVTAGGTVEMTMPQAGNEGSVRLATTAPGGGGTDNGDTAAWSIRHEYVWVNHKKMGKLSLGHTSVASDGNGEISSSGTTGIYSRTGRTYGRSLHFINTTTATTPTVSVNTVDGVFNDLNVDRTDVIRYDTPSFMGASAKVARHTDGQWSVGLKYGGKFGGFKVSAGAGYINHNSGSSSSNFTALGSIGILHDSGLNVSYQTGKKNFAGPNSKSTNTGNVTNVTAIDTTNLGGRDDPFFHGVQIGYQAPKLTSLGSTSFSVSWQSSQNIKENDGDAETWGVQVMQKIDALGANVGVSYQTYSYDSNSESTVGTVVNETFDDIDVFALQTTFNF